MAGVTVKQEEAIVMLPSSGSPPSAAANLSARPREGIHDAGLPPFLVKIFNMVEDPSTDAIVSWSLARNSFVVWDCHRFSATLLPIFFKHSNFSSFIRQLNTYGFRKVDPDKWEFANELFLGGQKHLLKTIKRRRHMSQSMQHQEGGACVELGQYGLECEIERLKRDRNVLMMEIVKLRQQQKSSKDQVGLMEDRLQSTEKKQHQMMTFLAKVLNEPSFVQQFVESSTNIRERRGIRIGRKRRLAAIPYAGHQGLDQPEELTTTTYTEMDVLLSSALDCESNNDVNVENPMASSVSISMEGNLGNDNDTMWAELMKGHLLDDNPEEEVMEWNQWEDYLNLDVEDLFDGPVNWGEDLQDLMDTIYELGSTP